MNLLKRILQIFRKPLPIWAYGLECDICKKSFGTPEYHYNYVQMEGTNKKHEGKIPILRGNNDGKKERSL